MILYHNNRLNWGVCNSRFYDSEKNFLKIYSILNILLSVLEILYPNSESVCNSINGALKGLKFRDTNDNVVIEPIKTRYINNETY